MLVSLTLVQKEVPVPITLRLYLPKDWAQDKARRVEAKVPESILFKPRGTLRWRRSMQPWQTAFALAWSWPTAAMAVRQTFVPGLRSEGFDGQWVCSLHRRSIRLMCNSLCRPIPGLGDLPNIRDLRHQACRLCS